MTINPANIAVFKSKTLALIDVLKLPPDVVVGLGLTLAVAHGVTAGLDGTALHQMLDEAIDETLDAVAREGIASDQ